MLSKESADSMSRVRSWIGCKVNTWSAPNLDVSEAPHGRNQGLYVVADYVLYQ